MEKGKQINPIFETEQRQEKELLETLDLETLDLETLDRKTLEKLIRSLLEENNKLKEKAEKDDLTGLLKRKAFKEKTLKYIEEIENQKKFSRREEDEHTHMGNSVLFLDIDNFKKINDTYGHNVGDIVLEKIADVLTKMTRQSATGVSDIVARWGGEEMVVALLDIDENEAIKKAEKIRIAIESIIIEEHPDIKITASIGIGRYKEDLKKTIEESDIAMYGAKIYGKNQVKVFDQLTEDQLKYIQTEREKTGFKK